MRSISSSRLLILIDSSNPYQTNFTRSRILSSCLLILMKSTWQDPISQYSRLLVLMKSTWRYSVGLVFSSFHPREFDLTTSTILSSCLLVLFKSTWRDHGSRFVFSFRWSRLDEIKILYSRFFVQIKSNWLDQYLVFPSFFLVKLTWRDQGSCLLIIKSTWWYPGSCLHVFSSWRGRLDVIEDLVFLSSRLVFLSSWLLFSSSRLVFSSLLPDLPHLLGALLSFRTSLDSSLGIGGVIIEC